MANKIVAVWGSPGSGKTILSIKLAIELARAKKNVTIVFNDIICPTINTILPGVKNNEKSLGKILSSTNINGEKVLENCTIIEKNKYIAMIGYKQRDNIYSYPEYSVTKVIDFFKVLASITDYIIIDCSSYFFIDQLTSIALEKADTVIRLISPNLKSISYFDSNLPLLIDNTFSINKHINILSNIRYDDPINELKEIYDIKYKLPHLDEIREQLLSGRIMNELSSRERYSYNQVLRSLSTSIMGNNYDDNKNRIRFWRK
ncbi:ParA family protein [Clostridioides difficile]|nr:ParA family protein [Clostridioides difficile]MCL6901980.1 ParA family protein [Clostridioides difficile]MCP3377840.1 ParA family protein [Clostridioides difficile]MDE3493470.1 ParA family protein [Clostridioides difficile]MDE3707879.1 ParA family protein [Clostridioides difficile]